MTGVKVVHILGSFCWQFLLISDMSFSSFKISNTFLPAETIFLSCFWEIFFGQNSPKCCQFCLTNDDMQDNASDMLRFLLKY